MIKVRILTKCRQCEGKAYLPAGEGVDNKGKKYTRYHPCPICEGTGEAGKWVELPEFLLLLEQVKGSHKHISSQGDFHLTVQEV